MKKVLTIAMLFGFVFVVGSLLAQEEKKPPKELTFESKMGAVTYNHEKHVERAKGDCKTCHPALFAQDKAAPLNYKDQMHKKAETDKTSCATCHHAGGASFETKGNCNKCHIKKTA